MIEIKSYEDMSHMTSDDIINLMSTKSTEERAEFKTYCSTDMEVKQKDGSTKIRKPVFFEIRLWVVKKYFPDALKTQGTGGKAVPSFYDRIMEL